MTFILHIPAPPLNTFIKALYVPAGSMPYAREKILPVPWVDLKINFGGPVAVSNSDHAETLVSFCESWVVGLWSTYHLVEWLPDMHFVGVSFKPGGAFPFLRLPLSELHNQVVSLDAIWGSAAAELRERLYAATKVQARFALCEQFLLKCLREAPRGLNAVQYAIREITRRHGVVSIRTLSDDMGISQKHLITQFNQLVGAPPKAMARLSRFAHMLDSIHPLQPPEWTQVAHQFDYYDQSHFNRDFEMFTGHSPTDYWRLRRQVQVENPQHARFLRPLPAG
jgi:AraC-like DNA-binding protein